MKNRWRFAVIPGALLVAAAAFALVLLVVRFLWAWTVPDLFPGAVEQGFIAAEITWYTAFKLAIFAAILGGLAGARSGKASR